MLQTVRFYNCNIEKEIKLSEDDIKRVPFIDGMLTFYGKLPETVSISMENFEIGELQDLFTNKTVQLILRNVVILDYLCISLKDIFMDVSTDIHDLIPFVSYIKGENSNLQLLITDNDLFAKNHIEKLYDLLLDYSGGMFHPLIYNYFENYLIYLYENVWKIPNIDIDARQALVVYPFSLLRRLVSELPRVHEVLLERTQNSEICWRDEIEIFSWLAYLTNGFINKNLLEKNPGLTLSGGLLSALISMPYEDLDEYIDKASPDLDIYVVSETSQSRSQVLIDLLESFEGHKYFAAFNKSIITVFIKGAKIPIQFILSDYHNVFDMMSTFDMSHLQLAYNIVDGLVMTAPCYIAHRDRVTSYNKLFYLKPYRLVKALDRGYSVSPNIEIEYYINLFGNKEELLELGRFHTYRRFPKKFKMRRFLRYLGKKFKPLDFLRLSNYLMNGEIEVNANFRNPVFDKEYSSDDVLLNLDYDYKPVIRLGKLDSIDHTFVFGYNKLIYNGNSYIVIPDYSKNIFMWHSFRNYLDRVLELFSHCKKYSYGSDDKRSLNVLENDFLGVAYSPGEWYLRRLVIFISNMRVIGDTLYIYLGMKL